MGARYVHIIAHSVMYVRVGMHSQLITGVADACSIWITVYSVIVHHSAINVYPCTIQMQAAVTNANWDVSHV